MNKPKRTFVTDALASRLQQRVAQDLVTTNPNDTRLVRPSDTRELITCVLHNDIVKPSDIVDCTRLMMIRDRGSRKAWQIVVGPDSTAEFTIAVNGTTIGPFTSATTTAAFQAAVDAAVADPKPQVWVVHGNFFVYPASTLTIESGETATTLYEVPWIPLVGDAYETRVGVGILPEDGEFLRGSTQSAEFISGYAFTIRSHIASGGGDDIIQFRPTDVCEGIGFSCDCVTAVVLTAGCNSSLAPGDIVQVWDQTRALFNMPQGLLFASAGWAHKVKVTEADQYGLPFDLGPCRWVVTNMNCVEEEGY